MIVAGDGHGEKVKATANKVILTIYIESLTIRSNQRNDSIKRIKPKPLSSKPKNERARGYDRRAQLLAYAQELRHANSRQSEVSMKGSKPKHKKWESPRLQLSSWGMFHRRKWRWRYERIVTEDYSNGEGLCFPGRIKRKNAKTSKIRRSHFCKRLKCMLKELTCAWRRNKG